MKNRILIVDDEASVRFAIEEALTAGGFDVAAVANVDEAMMAAEGVSAVVTDLVMPGQDGLSLIARLRERDPELPVILLTARGSERTAVAAMKAGAYDYLAKPFGIEELRLVVGRAVEACKLRRASHDLALSRLVGETPVGQSPAWISLMQQVRRVARRDVTVLLRGETGTGKELVAAAIAAHSERKNGPFVRFNCAAIPAELAEAELFGHARGAFTGANASREGFFGQAHGGTLVLDEIGELPLAVQASLLRALQAGEIQRVGAGRVERVDVRVVASTHRDLQADVAAGRFREDLFYRLAVIELHVPPLRERKEDLPLLIEALKAKWCQRLGLGDVSFTAELVQALTARPWPGNVRELDNLVARILTLFDGPQIGVEALAPLTRGTQALAGHEASLRAQMDAFERQVLRRVLEESGHNKSLAARRLGITRTTLLDKLKRYGGNGDMIEMSRTDTLDTP